MHERGSNRDLHLPKLPRLWTAAAAGLHTARSTCWPGPWANGPPNEFLLDLNFIANIHHYTLRRRFEGDHLEMTAGQASGLIRDGRIIGTRRAAAACTPATRRDS